MKADINPEYTLKVRQVLGLWVKEYRMEKGYSQRQLASILETSQSTITKIENGKWNFTVDTLTVLGSHLGFFTSLERRTEGSDLLTVLQKRLDKIHPKKPEITPVSYLEVDGLFVT